MKTKTRICFVCLGNIVRSPLAENLFRHLAEQNGVANKYDVDSAGTSAYHVGESPDARMRRVAARRGFHYDGRSRQFRQGDFERYDLIVAMDPNNQRSLQRLAITPADEKKIHLMRDFDPEAGSERTVPDPYYGGVQGFELVYDIVERACFGLLSALEDGSISLENDPQTS